MPVRGQALLALTEGRHGRDVDARRRRRAALASLVLSVTLTVMTIHPRSAAAADITEIPISLTVQGQTGAYVVTDALWYTRDNATLTLQDNGSRISVAVQGGTWWNLHIDSGDDSPLRPGTYLGARRALVTQGVPGLDFSGDGRGCNEVTGWFSIDELERDAEGRLTSLGMTFEHHCEGEEPAVVGRLLAGTAAERHPIVFPDQIVKAPTPVRLPSSHRVIVAPPVRQVVTDVRITGVHADEVTVAADGCTGRQAARQEPCVVWLRMAAEAAGPRSAALEVVSGDTTTAVPISLEATGGRSRLLLNGEPGSYITDGQRLWFDVRAGAQIRTFAATSTMFRARITQGGHWWYLNASPPAGDVFGPGRTYRATSTPQRDGSDWFEVYGDGRSCDSTSTFTTEHVVATTTGLERFSVHFDMLCDDGKTIRGLFEHRVPVGDQDPPAAVSDLRVEVAGSGDARTATLRWAPTPDTALTMVRRNDGPLPAPTTRGGSWAGAGTMTTVTVPAPDDRDTAVAVFPVDANGNVGPSTAVVIEAGGNVVTAPGSPGRASGGTPAPDPLDDPDPVCAFTTTTCNPGIVRLAGASRYETAIQMSRRWDPESVEAVVLARGDVPADALTGVALAAAHDAPLLLTPTTELPAAVREEIGRVLATGKRVYVLGGTGAVAATVVDVLAGDGYELQRLFGANRFETAAQIAAELGEGPTFLVDGTNFADALAAGPVAAAHGAAILLTDHDRPAPATVTALGARSGALVAVGGPAAAAHPEATAVVGASRYETATRLADAYLPGASSVVVARGDDPADALAGGALAHHEAGVVLTTNRTGLASAPVAWLCAHRLTLETAFAAGGRAALPDNVADAVGDIMRHGVSCAP